MLLRISRNIFSLQLCAFPLLFWTTASPGSAKITFPPKEAFFGFWLFFCFVGFFGGGLLVGFFVCFFPPWWFQVTSDFRGKICHNIRAYLNLITGYLSQMLLETEITKSSSGHKQIPPDRASNFLDLPEQRYYCGGWDRTCSASES